MVVFKQNVDKRAIHLLIGCYCLNPKLMISEDCSTNEADYPESFHKIVWGAMYNIAKRRNVEKISPLDIEKELVPFVNPTSVWKNNNGYEYVEKAIEEVLELDILSNAKDYYDTVRKYSIIRSVTEELNMDVSFLYDENDESKLLAFSHMRSEDLIREITNKFSFFKDKWKSTGEDNYSFKMGEGIKDRLSEHKAQINTFGYPFRSAYLNTVYRGMKPKKYILRSAPSGGSKSRAALADGCNMVADRIYDWSKKEWICTGKSEPVLFISTELEKEEIQDIILAYVSGIEQDRIESWDINAEEEAVLNEAVTFIELYDYYVDYQPDFTIDSITETIEKYIINKNISACFFDYINDAPSLYEYYFNKTHSKLRSDQILFMFSAGLKKIANKYGIFIGSSTQLNDSYKEDNKKDASALKGSKAIIEKADGGILALPVSAKDLKTLDPIIKAKSGFGYKIPNMSYYIFKNRGGKWKAIIVWTNLNMGNMRESDCFVTNYNYELIEDIEKTVIDFSFEDVGETKFLDLDSEIDGVELANDLIN